MTTPGTPQSTAGTSPDPVYMPDKPTMGEIKRVSNKLCQAVVGGKPNADYDGLEKALTFINHMQYRKDGADEAVNADKRNVWPNDKLITLKTPPTKVKEWLFLESRRRGYDTITYLKDPSGNNVYSVLESPERTRTHWTKEHKSKKQNGRSAQHQRNSDNDGNNDGNSAKMFNVDDMDPGDFNFGTFSFFLAETCIDAPVDDATSLPKLFAWSSLWHLFQEMFHIFFLRPFRTFVNLQLIVFLFGIFLTFTVPADTGLSGTIGSLATQVIAALPPASAWCAFRSCLPALVQEYAFTQFAIAPALWSLVLVLLGIGPHRMFAPAKVSRRERRLLELAAFRDSRIRSTVIHRSSFRHPRYRPSRNLLLRSVQEGEDNVGTFALAYKMWCPQTFHQNNGSRQVRRRCCISARGQQLQHRLKEERRQNLKRKKEQQAKNRKNFLSRKAIAKVENWDMELFSEQIKEARDKLPASAWDSDSDSDSGSDSTCYRCRGSQHSDCDSDSGGDSACHCCRGSQDEDEDEESSVGSQETDSVVPDSFPSDMIHLYITRIASTVASFVEDSLFQASLHIRDMAAAFPVVWDSGASVCVSKCKEDFIGELRPPPPQQTNGVGGPVKVEGCGHVSWTFKAKNNSFRTFILPAVYIPKAPQRLLSTICVLRCYPSETIDMTVEGLRLSGNNDPDDPTSPVYIPHDAGNHLPTATAYRHKTAPIENVADDHESATVVTGNGKCKARKTKKPHQTSTKKSKEVQRSNNSIHTPSNGCCSLGSFATQHQHE